MKKHLLRPLAPVLLTLAVMVMAGMPAFGQLPSTIIRSNQYVATTATQQVAFFYAGTNAVDTTRYSEVGYEIGFKGSNSSTANLTLYFKTSADGTNYATGPLVTWPVAITGVTTNRYLTNWNAGTWATVQFYYWTNASGNDLTNVFLYGYEKGYRRE